MVIYNSIVVSWGYWHYRADESLGNLSTVNQEPLVVKTGMEMPRWASSLQCFDTVGWAAPCGVVRIVPLRFLAGCHTGQLNQVLSVCHILACYIIVLWFIRAPFYVVLVFVAVCSVYWLFCLSCQYSPNELARKTRLRKPNRGEGIITIKSRPKRTYDYVGLLYFFIV